MNFKLINTSLLIIILLILVFSNDKTTNIIFDYLCKYSKIYCEKQKSVFLDCYGKTKKTNFELNADIRKENSIYTEKNINNKYVISFKNRGYGPYLTVNNVNSFADIFEKPSVRYLFFSNCKYNKKSDIIGDLFYEEDDIHCFKEYRKTVPESPLYVIMWDTIVHETFDLNLETGRLIMSRNIHTDDPYNYLYSSTEHKLMCNKSSKILNNGDKRDIKNLGFKFF